MDRKIIARFPSLLEAEAALSCLEAADVPALIDDRIAGALMPHASDAFGGFTVSVPTEDEARALELLGSVESPEPAEPTSIDRETDLTMRRATYGAVLGAIILPVIASFFSLALYGKAYSRNPERFWQRKGLFFFGTFFNVLVLGGVVAFALGMLADHKEQSTYGSCYSESAPANVRVQDCARVAVYANDARGKASAYGTLGIMHAKLGDFPGAIADFAHVIEADPKNEPAYADRGLVYALNGQMENALADLDDAIRLDATDPAPLNNRCFLRALGGKLPEALADCNTAEKVARASREHSRDLEDVYDVRGYVQWKSGHDPEALADFKEALKRNPQLATSLYGRGLVERRSGNSGSAEADINAAISIQPTVENDFDSISRIAQKQ